MRANTNCQSYHSWHLWLQSKNIVLLTHSKCPYKSKLWHVLGKETADNMLSTSITVSHSSDLGLDSILPHGEVLLTLLFPLRLQRKLQDKQSKMSGHLWLKKPTEKSNHSENHGLQNFSYKQLMMDNRIAIDWDCRVTFQTGYCFNDASTSHTFKNWLYTSILCCVIAIER